MTARETVELHHLFEGPEDAPVLVMANSLGTTLRMWEDQAPSLRERFRLLRYDHRGHGGSPVPSGPYEIGDLGRDVLALLDRLGVEQFSFCGLSVGGMVGMWLASEAPERVERLVLCCTAARFAPPEQWEERARTARAKGVGAIADAVLERWFTPPFRESHPGTVAWAGGMLRGTPAEGYAGCCEAIRDADLRGRLGAISAPHARRRRGRRPGRTARRGRAHPGRDPRRTSRGRRAGGAHGQRRAARGGHAGGTGTPEAGRK